MRRRGQALEKLRNQSYDVCVIGGGASGAGCALDAQLRGLRTILLDAGDFASATSSASTKIAHGGIRYLQQAVAELDIRQFQIVKRALRERLLMLQNAPFLTRRLEFFIPCFNWADVAYFAVGIKIYDWMAGPGLLSASRFVSRTEAIRHFPKLKTDRLVGGIMYCDGQFDDSRYNITLIQTFTENGGEALNYAKIIGFERAAGGSLQAAHVQDTTTGERFVLSARVFVNATGPASDTVRALAQPGAPPRIRTSKGSHILLPLEGFSNDHAFLVPKTEDGRVLFAIPWLGRLLVGTTEDEVDACREPVVQRCEAEYLLRHVNAYLKRPFAHHEMTSGIAGMRPLVRSMRARETKRLLRDDEVEIDKSSGLISILGGKWTTYRAMAEDTINAVQTSLRTSVTPSVTRHHRLAGSEGYREDYPEKLSREFGLPTDIARHLAGKYGSRAPIVLAPALEDPKLFARIAPGYPSVLAEVLHAIRREMAVSIEDILARRIGLQFFSWRDAVRAGPRVARLLKEELGWSADQERNAVHEYGSKINRLLLAAGLNCKSTE